MVTRYTKTPLPRDWKGLPHADKALIIADIKIRRHSRIRMKLLVFPNRKTMRMFFNHTFDRHPEWPGIKLCRNTMGVVKNLSREVQSFKGGRESVRMEADRRFACLMCLNAKDLTQNVITHESVHAALAMRRRLRPGQWPEEDRNWEESICYPAGYIAAEIVNLLREEGLCT